MRHHFESIQYLHGNCTIRLPNHIFRTLSTSIRNRSGKINSQQVAFSYAYLIAIGFLYKYTNFVDADSGTYIQNADIKELLGYSKTTKSIDKVIKKGGTLDELELTATVKDYPIYFEVNAKDKINGIPLREFQMVSELSSSDYLYDIIKETVKNRNYEIKEPLYMTTATSDSEYGTLYNVQRTHEITIKEFLTFISDDELDNTDFLVYGYFKSRCKGYPLNMRSMAVYKIINEIGIDKNTFYLRLNTLKSKEYIGVTHKSWKKKEEHEIVMEANDYYWLGV